MSTATVPRWAIIRKYLKRFQGVAYRDASSLVERLAEFYTIHIQIRRGTRMLLVAGSEKKCTTTIP